MTQRALIAGGSLAGLTTGILLRRAGWDVTILERNEGDLSDRGGGITTQDPLWQVMAGAGLDVAHRPGIKLHRRIVFAADGSIVEDAAVEEIVTSWDTLYRLLLGAFPSDRYRRGMAIEHCEQDESEVTITLSDGSTICGDLLVAADGAGSTVRGQLLPQVQAEYANYIAWRGLVDEAALPPLARRTLVDAFSFCAPPGEQMLSYTVPGPQGEEAPGRRRHNFVWYQPAEPERVLPDLLTDEDGEVHRPNIPPTRIRPAVIEAMRDHANAVLSPAYAALVRSTEHPFLQPVTDHVTPRMAFGRVVLLGDAAAQARPHAGAGTTKALEDAAALVACLSAHNGDVAAGVRAFEGERLEPAHRMVMHGRWLGRHLDPANGPGCADQTPATLIGQAARPQA